MMENSVTSSLNKVAPASKPGTIADNVTEESGWTQYIEDFDAQGNNCYSGCSSYMSASLVSDAGSGPEWKNKHAINNNTAYSSLGEFMPKKLKFKKRIPFDDSLEDTASSPVNSPKITAFFNRMDLNSRKMDSDGESPMGDRMSIDKHVVQYDDNDIIKDHYGSDLECIQELKEKGLCLVPLSMVVNYLGS